MAELIVISKSEKKKLFQVVVKEKGNSKTHFVPFSLFEKFKSFINNQKPK